jgi:hypothetical protein
VPKPITAENESQTRTLGAVVPQSMRASPIGFQIVYAALTIFYGTLGVSYLVNPAGSVGNFSRLDKLLGGPTIPNVDVPPWRYVTVIGMTNLALMCLMLMADLRRNYPLLVPAVFFKAFNAVLWFVYYGQTKLPVFLFAAFVDVGLVVVMVEVARRAHARLDARGP